MPRMSDTESIPSVQLFGEGRIGKLSLGGSAAPRHREVLPVSKYAMLGNRHPDSTKVRYRRIGSSQPHSTNACRRAERNVGESGRRHARPLAFSPLQHQRFRPPTSAAAPVHSTGLQRAAAQAMPSRRARVRHRHTLHGQATAEIPHTRLTVTAPSSGVPQ